MRPSSYKLVFIWFGMGAPVILVTKFVFGQSWGSCVVGAVSALAAMFVTIWLYDRQERELGQRAAKTPVDGEASQSNNDGTVSSPDAPPPHR